MRRPAKLAVDIVRLAVTDEDWLHELSIDMFPEDGRLRVYGVGDDGVTAFTQDGIENLRQVTTHWPARGYIAQPSQLHGLSDQIASRQRWQPSRRGRKALQFCRSRGQDPPDIRRSRMILGYRRALSITIFRTLIRRR